MATLLWMQAGDCGGDSMSLLNGENPDILGLLENYSIELLWHPSLSVQPVSQLMATIESIKKGEQELTVLVVEGSIIRAPDDTGMYDTMMGKPKKDLILDLCEKAQIVVAMGTCASFGGISAAPPNPSDSIGLQWFKDEKGGFLGEDWKSKAGLPVVNIPGCPAHPTAMTQTLIAALLGQPLDLDHLNRPGAYYTTLVHQGCTRNEYHEYDVEEECFGGLGCLFFNLGCQGPYTSATCNSILWNRQKSKTRAGVPCFGCTSPSFPKDQNLFETKKIGNIPVELPLGVRRAHYMAYKGLAKEATPQRLKERKSRL